MVEFFGAFFRKVHAEHNHVARCLPIKDLFLSLFEIKSNTELNNNTD